MSLKPIEWTEEEEQTILVIADWYAAIMEQRGADGPPDHALRALYGVACETFNSNKQYDAMAKGDEQATLDEQTVADLTAEPATADELAAVCGVLASTLGVTSGVVNEADLMDYRAKTVAQVLAQVRLRNQTEHLGSGYVQ